MDDYSIKVALDSTEILTGASAWDRYTAAGLRADAVTVKFKDGFEGLGRSVAPVTAQTGRLNSELAQASLNANKAGNAFGTLTQGYKQQAQAFTSLTPQLTKVNDLLNKAAATPSSAKASSVDVAALLQEARARHAVTTAAQEAAIAVTRQAAADVAAAKGTEFAKLAQADLVAAKRAAVLADKASTGTALELIRAENAMAAAAAATAASLAAQSAQASKLAADTTKAAVATKVLAGESRNLKAEVAAGAVVARTAGEGVVPRPRFSEKAPKGSFEGSTVQRLIGQGKADSAALTVDPRAAAAIDKQVASLASQAAVLGLTARQTKLFELSQAGATAAQLKSADASLLAVERFGQAQARQKALAAGITSFARGATIAITALGAAALGAFFAVNKLVDKAGSFKDLQDQTGGSAAGFASMQQAADVAGISVEQIANSTTRLNQRLAQVSDDGKGAAAALRAIGVNVAEFRTLGADAQFKKIAEQLNKYADGGEKVALVQQLLGIGGARQLKVFKELSSQQEKGIVLTQDQIEKADLLSDANKRLGSQLSTVAQIAAIEFGPAFLALRESLVDIAADILGVDKATGKLKDQDALRNFAQDSVVLITGVVEVFAALAKELLSFPDQIKAFAASTKNEYNQLALFLGKAVIPGGQLQGLPGVPVNDSIRILQQDADQSKADAIAASKKAGPSILGRNADFSGSLTPKSDAIRAKFDADNLAAKRASEQAQFPGDARFFRSSKPAMGDSAPRIKVPNPEAERRAKQLAQAELQKDLKFLKDTLADQRDELRFHNTKVDLLYEEGTISLVQALNDRKASVAQGVKDELDSLRGEQDRLRAALKNPNLTQDPTERYKLREQLAESITRAAKVEKDAMLEAANATLQDAAALKRFQEQVESTRASLLALAGDVRGAAQIKIDQEQTSDRVQLRQSVQGPITPQIEAELERELELRRKLRESLADYQQLQRNSGGITQRLQDAEERIALAQTKGAVTETQALVLSGQARRRVVGDLEKQVELLEEISNSPRFKDNLEIKLSTERARLELDKLKSQLDPLKDQFDNLFKSAGANTIEKLLSGGFGGFNQGKFDQGVTSADRAFNKKVTLIKAGSLTGSARDDALLKADKEHSEAVKKARKDATPSIFSQAKQAGRDFGVQVALAINQQVARDLATKIFSEGGLLGGLGGIFADIFGGKDRNKVDPTAGVAGSFANLKLVGIDPATLAFQELARAVSETSGKLSPDAGGADNTVFTETVGLAQQVRLFETQAAARDAAAISSTGGFARYDRSNDPSAKPEPVFNPGGNPFSNLVASDNGGVLGDLFKNVVVPAITRGNPILGTAVGLGNLLGGLNSSAGRGGVPKADFGRAGAGNASGGPLQGIPLPGVTPQVSIQDVVAQFKATLPLVTNDLVQMQAATKLLMDDGLYPLKDAAIAAAQALRNLPTPNTDSTVKGTDVFNIPMGGEADTGALGGVADALYGDQGIAKGADAVNLSLSKFDTTAIDTTKLVADFGLQALSANQALSQLPAIMQLIALASNSGGGGGGMGGMGGGIGSLFTQIAGGSGSSGAMDFIGNSFISMFGLEKGGFTGNVGTKEPAGIVHGGEFVFSAPTVKKLGLPFLNSLHQKAKMGDMELNHKKPKGFEVGGFVPPPSLGHPAISPVNMAAMNAVARNVSSSSHSESRSVQISSPINITVPGNTSKETANQIAVKVGQQIRAQVSRGTS